jgi:glyoxylase-like metal-dependent hydrolase (beta-lactamase superfamily II)
MQCWICVTCGTQFAPSESTPTGCPICQDQRQYIGHQGQQWTTLDQLLEQGFHNVMREQEPGLLGIGTEPKFAIGQRALLVQTAQGNILWDCVTVIDDAAIAAVENAGGLKAITISHPHYYSAMVEWATHFDAPIYLHEADRRWIMRPDRHVQFWSGPTLNLTDDVTVLDLGGHFPGSTVLHWSNGANGKGVLLTGDTISVAADRDWCSFMYSYPNLIPLPAQMVRNITDALAPYAFERLYSAWFETVVPHDAKNAVNRSAERYIRALAGEFPTYLA